MNGGEDEGVPKIGVQVHSDAEAYSLCNVYALRKGFSIRKGHVRRDSSNNIRQRDFVCSKEGFQRDEDLCEVKNINRIDRRTGCKALIRFNVKDGIWTISHINYNHNHELAKPEERDLLRSCRKISHVLGGMRSSKVNVGTEPTQSDFHVANGVGGVENVGVTQKNTTNYLRRRSDGVIEAEDAQSLLNHCKHKQGEDPNFFYSIQVDQYGRMTNFFWRDGRSKLDYDCFGDVVCFDTTFQANKYNMICAPLVGVNHHWQNVLFGCAFLLDESIESFTWLFQTFLESMGNKQPKTIFTDEDDAIANAVGKVFPQTHHRLCPWLIAKHATRRLARHYALPGFKEQLDKCFHWCYSEAEFEISWVDMMKKFNLEDHLWLRKLYSLREKWCSAFNLNFFSANIESTQRIENTKHFFYKISAKTMDLIDFLHHYEKKTKRMRLVELEEDYHCKYDVLLLKVNSGILTHGVNVYTNRMFSFFEEELMSCMGVRMKEVSNDGELHIYEAIEEGQGRVYKVQFSSLTSDVTCCCKLFESMGMLCRHALKAFDVNNLTSIPVQYLLKRWTKDAKNGISVSCDISISSGDEKSLQSLRLSKLMHEGNNIYSIASLSDSGTKIVKDKLAEAMRLLEKDRETINMLENLRKVDEQPSDESDLPTDKAKGQTNARLKSNSGKRKRKMTKGQCNQEMDNLNESVGNSSFGITITLQGNDQIPHLSQDSSQFLTVGYPFGQWPHLSQDLNYCGFDRFQTQQE
ncbi:hypothetical protein ACOSP7_004455 [Xanthoceras sorbifolium]